MLLGNLRIACGSEIASLNLIEIRHIFLAFFLRRKLPAWSWEEKHMESLFSMYIEHI